MNTATKLLQLNPVFLDTETTGLGRYDEIVEVAVVDLDGSVLINTLVRPASAFRPASSRFTASPTVTWPAPGVRSRLAGIAAAGADHPSRLHLQRGIRFTHDRAVAHALQDAPRRAGPWPVPDADVCKVQRPARRESGRLPPAQTGGRRAQVPACRAATGCTSSLADAELARRLLLHMAGRFL